MKTSKIIFGAFILSSFFLTGCDQKPTAEQINCSKPVKDMSKAEMEKCGKGGHFSSEPTGENKKW